MSTLRLTTISNQSGSATVPSETVISGSAKAWVNFNGTGTVAIRAGFNVSSITDNGAGDYTVNFTSPMVDANYSIQALAGYRNVISAIVRVYDSPAPSTSAVRLTCSEGAVSAGTDTPQFTVVINR